MADKPNRTVRRLTWLLVVLFVLFALPAWAAQASPPFPRTPEIPVRPPTRPAPTRSLPDPQTTLELGLPPLKAVLIVGPIDGDYGAWTNEEKVNMDLAANELSAHGVTVYKFYAPNNDWGQIKAAAKGAHFLMYRGHGVYWSSMPYPIVGGFSLSSGTISSDQIRSDLALAPNAIVMLYGCFTAGSSGGDEISISLDEAKRRVAMYSDPFLDIGAAGYYADWFGDAFQMYIRYLFGGMTQREAYEAFYDYSSDLVWRGLHLDHPEMTMYLGWDYWYNPLPQYNNAFAGLPDKTLAQLFSGMEVMQKTIAYLAEGAFPVRSYPVNIDIASQVTTAWMASLEPAASWASLSTGSGFSGEDLFVYLMPPSDIGAYETTLTITASDPAVQPRAISIPVKIIVVETVTFTHLPVVQR